MSPKRANTLLIAERFNLKGRDIASLTRALDERNWERYLGLALRLGAFQLGPSRVRLASISVIVEDSMNLLPPAGPGKWDYDLAREVVFNTWAGIATEYSLVWLCGRRVQQAFQVTLDWGDAYVDPYFKTTWVPVPHPSGLARTWSDESRVAEIREKIERVLRERDGGIRC